MPLQTLKPRIAELRTSRVGVMVDSSSWRAGKTTDERGYNWKWRKARERFLSERPLCVMCQSENRIEPATVVDHITPHRGDEALFWDESNWQSLCKRHHDSDKRRQENGVKLG